MRGTRTRTRAGADRRLVRWTAAILALAIVFAFVASVSARATPVGPGADGLSVTGTNAVARTTEPGRLCADGGDGSYRHVFAEAPLEPGMLSQLPGRLRATFDVHYDLARVREGQEVGAFLSGRESHVTLSNDRGTVQIELRGGSCESGPVAFDGRVASWDGGTWVQGDLAGTGSYRGITGSGTFGFTAETNPGADNAWSLRIAGDIQVLQPVLHAEIVRTSWGNLGLDYLLGIVTVVYRVANTGPGDAFDVVFASASAPGGHTCGEGATVRNPCPGQSPDQPLGTPTTFAKRLGDLAGGCDPEAVAQCDTEVFTVRYQLPRGEAASCNPTTGGATGEDLTLLACAFDTQLQFSLGDALDVALTQTRAVTATTPAFPPPL